MSKWTNADLKRLGVAELPPKQKRLPKPEPRGLTEIKTLLAFTGIDFQTEYKFHPLRKWRFDIAIEDKRIAIEYEGTNSAKSRHTTLTGYSADTTKYNAAAILGWKVLRYTALNFREFAKDLSELI